ncbi:hypothetical protein WQ54_17095 [Bacillus sp. SA1-12]|uniref:VanY-A/VanY-F/VanY-M family D-Ala-D-Ala carboxypeptidase n=1 Tax=Bacillus sp. SA1-12 TaxID=1455638 RepID=UPI000626ED0E|nr:VanY-A/VanY-F/VanY-M family D-Ala-D-Ala carboxypeptidase [Bacillus sp. SA1-12]KKI91036.1 hypothetical protein WQ54_17095 [Bacillus sp. SA1-12]
MKKWGFLLILVGFIGLADVNNVPFFQDRIKIQQYEQYDMAPSEERGSSETIENIEITKEQIYQGSLLLVNKEFPVQQESIRRDVVNLAEHNELIRGYSLNDNGILLSEEVAQKFSEMVAGAEKEGIYHFSINSGFRDLAEQSALFQELGADYALPAGYSEHNLGLSLDVGSTKMKMNEAPEGKWIEQNAWKYGFILRYPKDKVDITGIQYEPWHIRYVGLPHSAIMQEKHFTLEEYLDYVKEEPNISASVEGEKYTISYYPISKATTITVPKNVHYEISGNNIDGVILTVQE